MIKITDVAREAGVSPSTVSHVLNGKRPISGKTCNKVLTVIERLGYQPNTNARALKSKHSGIIGFFASDITQMFMTQIIRGVEKITGKTGAHILFTSGVEFAYDLRKALIFLKSRNVDGIIISHEITRKMEAVDLDDMDLPIVSINQKIADHITCVLPDNREGGYSAAMHLLSRGVKHPALVVGPQDRSATKERLQGFYKGMEDGGIPASRVPVYYGGFDFQSGYEQSKILLSKYKETDGIFCGNDFMAAGVIDCARRQKIAIPEKLKVIGYDNRDFSAFWPTPISTFSQPLEAMGEMSATVLMDQIQGKKPHDGEIRLKSSLIIRQSSACCGY